MSEPGRSPYTKKLYPPMREVTGGCLVCEQEVTSDRRVIPWLAFHRDRGRADLVRVYRNAHGACLDKYRREDE